MAKVDKVDLKWKGVWSTFEVHFTKTSGFFIKNCPPEVERYSDSKFYNRYDTLEMVKSDFKHYANIAQEKMKSISKVLLVSFNVSSDIFCAITDQPLGHYSISKNEIMGRFVGGGMSDGISGIGFSISYDIVQRIQVGEGVEYYRSGIEDTRGRYGRVFRKDNQIEVPYSEAAENTLKDVQNNLINMVKKLTVFFSQREEVIANILESGQLRLNQSNE